MNDRMLYAELTKVANRYRALARGVALLILWLVLGLAAVAVLRCLRGQDYALAATLAGIVAGAGLLATVALYSWAHRAGNFLWLARRLEQRHPELDARLLAALEQHPDEELKLGFLQQMVIDQAVTHARRNQWAELVPTRRLRLVRIAAWGMFLVFALTAVAVAGEWRSQWKQTPTPPVARQEPPFTIKVEPENASIERNTALLVMARFNAERLPGEVTLLYRDGDNNEQPLAMTKSLDDPLFAARIASVKRDGSYAVRYGDAQTQWYKVTVFDYPALKEADAQLKYPAYTGLEDKTVKDSRSVTAVEGTHVTLSFHLNKPVRQAVLVPAERRADLLAAATLPSATAPAQPVVLTPDPADPTNYTLALDLKQSQNYQLQLVDGENRTNRDRPQMSLNVTVNRPVDLKVTFPNRDLDVSALQEVTVRAQVWDDYGVKRVGITYAMVGQPPHDEILAQDVPGKERRDLTALIPLEKLGAAPDQLLSYHLWAEDIGPDGKVRRVEGPMYFADVRPFEEIYRQGEELAQGQQDPQQQRQQQQQGQQGNQNAQQADQVANTLKQVIAATWNIMRRETADQPSPQFVPDVTSVESSQTRIRDQAQGLGDQVTDERSQAYLTSGIKNMEDALTQLKAAASTPAVQPLTPALASEQAAYNDLLKLRAREFEVTRGNRQQANAQNASQQRRQQQLNQMNPRNQQNPYQARRNAQQQQQDQNQQAQQETDQQRETRQVLSRLRELAQRQDDLNRQMQELQSALQQAQNQQQRDEIQRQLANLRDQQQQQLRDADELRDRMDQPQNQEPMADARQQLEQTRNDLQQAAQNLNNGQMQQAAAARQRAGEQLNNLQNQMRRAAAGQFGEQMTQMRQDARNLEQQQQQIDRQLANLNNPAQTAPAGGQPGLRNNNQQQTDQQRRQIAQSLQEQRDQLQNLLNNMQQTIEQADEPQPLLSRQLYDSYRNAQQQQADRNLDTARQLVQQGLLPEAQQTDTDASQALSQLRQGVDQAAAGVLGDDTAALRRAQEELDNLAQQLERERGRAAASQAATQPDRGGTRQLAGATQPGDRAGAAGTRPGGPGALAGTQPGNRGDAVGTQPGDRQLAQSDRGGNLGRGQPGARGGNAGGRGNPQAGQPRADNQPNPDGQPGDQGQQAPDDQQLAQGGRGAAGQQLSGTPRGGRAGRGANGARPGDQAGTQPGDQQPDDQNPQLAQGGRGNAGLRGANGQARGGRAGRGGAPQPGDPTAASQPGDQQPGDQQANDQQPNDQQPDDQNPQLAQGGGRGNAGLRGANAQGRGGRAGRGAPTQQGDPNATQPADQGPAAANGGPITGDGYRTFTDNLRDVGELVNDPRLRDQAATIRQNATNLRQQYLRNFQPPAWNIVQNTLDRPLTDLRNAVSQEIQRRESQQAAIPLDKDAVPPAYQDQVRIYYEHLGSGK